MTDGQDAGFDAERVGALPPPTGEQLDALERLSIKLESSTILWLVHEVRRLRAGEAADHVAQRLGRRPRASTEQEADVIRLNGEVLDLRPGTLLVIKTEEAFRNLELLEVLSAELAREGVMAIVVKPGTSVESLEREQALGLLVGLAGQGESDWTDLPSHALEAMIGVHRAEADSMERQLRSRS